MAIVRGFTALQGVDAGQAHSDGSQDLSIHRQGVARADESRADARGGFDPGDCIVVRSVEEARRAAGSAPALMVIGGAEIYGQSVGLASRIHLTLVHTRIDDGDTFFAGWRGPEWRESSRERHEADEKNTAAYSFVTLERDYSAASGGSSTSMSRAAR